MHFSAPTILFGGTFDPVHEGHLHVAKQALSLLPGAQLSFVPAAQSPGKAHAGATPEQRLHWLRLAAEPLGFGVWDVEVRRGGDSYTVETLEEASRLGARRETLYWLVGADAYESFSRWKNPARIRELATILVVGRPGSSLEVQDPRDRPLGIPPHPASSTALRAELAEGNASSPWLPAPLRAELGNLLLPRANPYARK